MIPDAVDAMPATKLQAASNTGVESNRFSDSVMRQLETHAREFNLNLKPYSLSLVDEQQVSSSKIIHRFQLLHDHVPLWRGILITHLDGTQKLVYVAGSTPNINRIAASTPGVTETQARNSALDFVRMRDGEWRAGDIRLFYYPHELQLKLVYLVTLFNGLQRFDAFVDAHSAQVMELKPASPRANTFTDKH
jgi:hypothetical protein